jgi:hypothetical protein
MISVMNVYGIMAFRMVEYVLNTYIILLEYK